jgi:hypothetical protein
MQTPSREWRYLVDTFGYLDLYTNDASADELQTILESYDTDIFVPAHGHYQLKYSRAFGSLVDWNGRDDKYVDSPPMCGKWVVDATFRAGENDTCT